MADRALYYPYIHIHDVRWLKATLLIFDQVRRMIPTPRAQADSLALLPFTQPPEHEEPMLTGVDLWSPRVQGAQADLARRLRNDAENHDFRHRFGRQAAEALKTPGDKGFQIHQAKLNFELADTLRSNMLAWAPDSLEPYDLSQEYVELHPRVGEAVMATLAIACAMGEGLDIVGDSRSGPLHNCLISKQPEDVYDAWLNPATIFPAPPQATPRELLEFVISIACDPSTLEANNLRELGKDREPIRRLMHALEERAKNMVAMDPGKERAEQFRDETSKILKAWVRDRKNMANFWKKFFSPVLVDPSAKMLEKIIGKVAETKPSLAYGAAGAAAWAGLSHGTVLALGAGVSIGLFSYAAKIYVDITRVNLESPYRYLTLLEEGGLVFRTDLGLGSPQPPPVPS